MAAYTSWCMKASAKKGLSLRDLALFAMLAALTFAMKVAMAFLPNIEPVSLMVMLFMVVFGWRGLYPVYVYVAMEFLYYGIGIWNLYYLYVWAILAVLAWLCRKAEEPLLWALLSGVFGLAFGALCAVADIFLVGPSYAFVKWIDGIPFDIAHCAGNFVIALLLFKPLRKLMERLYHRM